MTFEGLLVKGRSTCHILHERALLSCDVCPREIWIAGAHLFRSHLLCRQIEWNKREPYIIRTNKNNIHVRIWGSNPPVVNIIIIYIECSTVVPLKKITKYYSKGSFPFFFSSKTNCNAVVAFLFEHYSEIKCYD